MEKPSNDVCFICKRTSYITRCKWCIYNELKKDGQRRNPTATQRAEWVKWEWGEEQGKNARDS